MSVIRTPIIVGDTLDFVERVPGCPASDGWTLVYRLTPTFIDVVPAPSITLSATVYDTDAYRIQADPTATVAWVAGTYTWTSWVERTGERQSLGSGRIELVPDPATIAAGYDGRTLAERAYDDARAALATFQQSNGRVKAYTIGTRSMEFSSSEELVTLVKFWENECSKEAAARAKRERRPNPRRYFTRLSNG